MSPPPDPLSASRRAVWAHVLPFAAWVAIMAIPTHASATHYAVQTVVSLVLFLRLRPWQSYPAPNLRHLPAALAAGVVVFGVWVLPESSLVTAWPTLKDAYLRYAVRPFGALPVAVTDSPYAPGYCGWTLTLLRLAGSAFVIAAIEEFFWRGFLYRRLLNRQFLTADITRIRWPTFWVVVVVFGFEHTRWLVGGVAGIVFGLLYLRTRDIWAAAIAHAVANLLLGVYVVRTGAFQFW